MTEGQWWVGWFVLAIACGIAGSFIGDIKRAAGPGFFLGLLFGPFGLIAAGFLDSRPQCRNCGGRLDAGNFQPRMCPHCRIPLDWSAETGG